MRKLNRNQTRISSFLTILLLTIFSLTSKKATATVDSTVIFSAGGLTFKFLRLEHDTLNNSNKDTSRVIYQIKSLGGSSYKDLSNFYTQMGICMKKVKARTGKISGSTRNYNSCLDFNSAGQLKYDCQINKGGTYLIFFEVDTVVGLSSVLLSAKAGTNVYNDSIWGLSVYCKEPLPVTWHKTYVEVGDGINKIHFSTASENNNWKFEVERSNGDGHFLKIGEVLSKAISGNSSMILKYDFNDMDPLPGNNYFRIKQIDYSRDSAYSPIFSAKVNPQPGLEVYPNPATPRGVITINAYGFERDTKHKISVYDNTAKVVSEYIFTGTGNIVYLHLDAGMYQVLVNGFDSMGRSKIYLQRLIVK